MAATYLQLVNQVLTRLRESTVSTVAATAYSGLIGALVNDAKREVEDAWQWSQLVDILAFSTVQGQINYELSSLVGSITSSTPSERTRLWIDPFLNKPLLLNVTPNYEATLEYEPTFIDEVNKVHILNQNSQDVPGKWQIRQSATVTTAGTWNKLVRLISTPNSAYTMNLYITNPQNDLANDTDVMRVPTAPVVQKAYLYALYERGEELGEALTLTTQKVEDTLSNAIALDQQEVAQYQQMAIPYGSPWQY